MNSVILIGPAECDALFRRRLAAVFTLLPSYDDALVVEERGSRVYVRRETSVELDDRERAVVLARVPAPHFWVIDYSSIALCKRVVSAIADDPRVLVDNDHGAIVPGDQFVGRVRLNPAWDWRGR